jgi:hypothetical protein
MNLAQKVVVWVGVLLILAMATYPPWITQVSQRNAFIGAVDAGPDNGQWKSLPMLGSAYGWIFKPPASLSNNVSRPGGTAVLYTETFTNARLDLGRLAVLGAAVCLATIGLAWSLRKRPATHL